MRTVSFTVPGEPQGKGRPRFARNGNWVRTYTPEATVAYEDYIRFIWGNRKSFGDRPVGLIVSAWFAVPKRASRETRARMLNGGILPMRKPDGDNILKVVADALSNGVAFNDDRQVVSMSCQKYYGEAPRLEIVVYDAGEVL